jgi:hypothetical protein
VSSLFPMDMLNISGGMQQDFTSEQLTTLNPWIVYKFYYICILFINKYLFVHIINVYAFHKCVCMCHYVYVFIYIYVYTHTHIYEHTHMVSTGSFLGYNDRWKIIYIWEGCSCL